MAVTKNMGNSNSTEQAIKAQERLPETPVQTGPQRPKASADSGTEKIDPPSPPQTAEHEKLEQKEVEGAFLVLCPCCQTSLQIDPSRQVVVEAVEKGNFVAHGNIPQSFFKSEFNTQGWVVKNREAKAALGLR